MCARLFADAQPNVDGKGFLKSLNQESLKVVNRPGFRGGQLV
jgi:hypothetical protein